MATGCRAPASASSRMTTANSTDESRAQPAPDVPRARRAGAAGSTPASAAGAPEATAPATPPIGSGPPRPNTSSAGAFSTEASRPPATASGRPIIAGVESASPPMTAITATMPPASDASGVTIERLPVTRPRSRHARAAASHSPPAMAKATARHSAAPAGGPYSTRASGRRMTSPTRHGPGHRGPESHGAHDLDHQEVVECVAEGRPQAEDDGEHARTLLDGLRRGGPRGRAGPYARRARPVGRPGAPRQLVVSRRCGRP